MRTLGSPWTALADGVTGPRADSLATRPIAARARDSPRKAVMRLRSGAGHPGAFRRLARDTMVFNVYGGLEMHGERG
jgi:hypothetical protein